MVSIRLPSPKHLRKWGEDKRSKSDHDNIETSTGIVTPSGFAVLPRDPSGPVRQNGTWPFARWMRYVQNWLPNLCATRSKVRGGQIDMFEDFDGTISNGGIDVRMLTCF